MHSPFCKGQEKSRSGSGKIHRGFPQAKNPRISAKKQNYPQKIVDNFLPKKCFNKAIFGVKTKRMENELSTNVKNAWLCGKQRVNRGNQKK